MSALKIVAGVVGAITVGVAVGYITVKRKKKKEEQNKPSKNEWVFGLVDEVVNNPPSLKEQSDANETAFEYLFTVAPEHWAVGSDCSLVEFSTSECGDDTSEFYASGTCGGKRFLAVANTLNNRYVIYGEDSGWLNLPEGYNEDTPLGVFFRPPVEEDNAVKVD
ncbi:MAG: hypothetical protein IBX57_00260 [Gammaproteobacteria bacterium]|nr:hypothetical protein [Gammaproteobacteria bacterium]